MLLIPDVVLNESNRQIVLEVDQLSFRGQKDQQVNWYNTQTVHNNWQNVLHKTSYLDFSWNNMTFMFSCCYCVIVENASSTLPACLDTGLYPNLNLPDVFGQYCMSSLCVYDIWPCGGLWMHIAWYYVLQSVMLID